MEETDPWGFPSPLPEAHLSRGSGFEVFQDRGRPREPAPSAISDQPRSPRRGRLARYHAYCLAFLSILLPAVFVAVGVAISLADGKPVASGWAVMLKIVEIVSEFWPIALAAVAVQSLMTWMALRTERYRAKQVRPGEAIQQPFDRSHLETSCFFLFGALTLAPLGSHALRSVFDVHADTLNTQIGVWYIDRTGQNELWSANSNSTLSSTDRLGLIQTTGEKYARSLLFDLNNQSSNNATGFSTIAQTRLSQPSESPTDFPSLDSSGSAMGSHGDATAPSTKPPVSQMEMQITTSIFDFMCSDWDLMLRDFEDFLEPGEMSYSASQTLGMSMSAGAGQTEFPTGTVSVATLNQISNNGSLAFDEIWEYSAIQCSWTQLFYNIPVRCNWDARSGLSDCVQYADSKLLLNNPDKLSGTQLVDFAEDFVVSGNVPTTDRISTASKHLPLPFEIPERSRVLTSAAERYIRDGGPSQPGSLDSQTKGTGFLNLSATVTPKDFSQRFGHLFNSWVALGYCPGCSSDIVVGNGTGIPAGIKQQYRQTMSTISSPGPPHLTVNWAWEAVILTLGLALLVVGILAIFFQYAKMSLPSAFGRRRTKQPMYDMDSMRMLLSPMHAVVPPPERYPMPHRPVSNFTPAARETVRDMRQRISARLSRMSGASFMLPIQGARIQEDPAPSAFDTKDNLLSSPAGGGGGSGDEAASVTSSKFFSRRYSNIPGERYPPPRRRSMSEDPSGRTSIRRPLGAGTIASRYSRHVPSFRYSLFPNSRQSWTTPPPRVPPKDNSNNNNNNNDDDIQKSERKENSGEGEGGVGRIVSVRYSHIPPFRYRAPQGAATTTATSRPASDAVVDGQQHGHGQGQGPSPSPCQGQLQRSESPSWIYDEFMSGKL